MSFAGEGRIGILGKPQETTLVDLQGATVAFRDGAQEALRAAVAASSDKADGIVKVSFDNEPAIFIGDYRFKFKVHKEAPTDLYARKIGPEGPVGDLNPVGVIASKMVIERGLTVKRAKEVHDRKDALEAKRTAKKIVFLEEPLPMLNGTKQKSAPKAVAGPSRAVPKKPPSVKPVPSPVGGASKSTPLAGLPKAAPGSTKAFTSAHTGSPSQPVSLSEERKVTVIQMLAIGAEPLRHIAKTVKAPDAQVQRFLQECADQSADEKWTLKAQFYLNLKWSESWSTHEKEIVRQRAGWAFDKLGLAPNAPERMAIRSPTAKPAQTQLLALPKPLVTPTLPATAAASTKSVPSSKPPLPAKTATLMKSTPAKPSVIPETSKPKALTSAAAPPPQSSTAASSSVRPSPVVAARLDEGVRTINGVQIGGVLSSTFKGGLITKDTKKRAKPIGPKAETKVADPKATTAAAKAKVVAPLDEEKPASSSSRGEKVPAANAGVPSKRTAAGLVKQHGSSPLKNELIMTDQVSERKKRSAPEKDARADDEERNPKRRKVKDQESKSAHAVPFPAESKATKRARDEVSDVDAALEELVQDKPKKRALLPKGKAVKRKEIEDSDEDFEFETPVKKKLKREEDAEAAPKVPLKPGMSVRRPPPRPAASKRLGKADKVPKTISPPKVTSEADGVIASPRKLSETWDYTSSEDEGAPPKTANLPLSLRYSKVYKDYYERYSQIAEQKFLYQELQANRTVDPRVKLLSPEECAELVSSYKELHEQLDILLAENAVGRSPATANQPVRDR